MNALLAAIDDIFYGRVLAGVAAAILGSQLVVVVLALRRRRKGRAPLPLWLHAIVGAAITALPIAAGISVHAARSLMFATYASGGIDPGDKGIALGRGISGQISAIPFAASATLLALALWVTGAAFTLTTRRSDGRARSLPPAALVGVGLVPIALGALDWSAGIMKGLAAWTGMRPDERSLLFERLLDAARLRLTYFTRVSAGAIVFCAVIAVVLIVRRARSGGETGATPRPRSAGLPLAVSAAAAVLAALLVVEARPFAAENETPWPPTTGSQFVYADGPPTPPLVGPDAPERAPVVTVFRDKVLLDGFAVDDLERLEDMLRTLRNNFMLLNPGGDFNELALIEADAATPSARLASVLRAVREAWYYRPMFAFTEKQTHVRPAFGTIDRVVVTGARCRLAYADDEPDEDDAPAVAAWKIAVPLRLEDFADYGAFARRLVELRRAGKPVRVRIDRASP